MASVTGLGPKQSNGYFVPLGNCAGSVYAYSGGSGAGGSFLPGNFNTTAAWAAGGTNPVKQTSTISSIGAGGIFRDEGKTVVSAGRVFRKVQLLCATGTVSTSGVNGGTATTDNYLTGYIELNSPAAGAYNANIAGNGLDKVAPVAYYPSLF